MSVAVRTAKMNIHPEYYDSSKNGQRYFSCTIFEPANYPLEISPDAKLPPEQIKAVLEKAKDDGVEVEIEFSQITDRFKNQKFVVYDVKPLAKKTTP